MSLGKRKVDQANHAVTVGDINPGGWVVWDVKGGGLV